MDISRETLDKLGEAIYIHQAMIKKAEDAEKAVGYLEEEGILSSDN